MPKLGMGPIRREQICRAAATVIAQKGFAGTTMRLVAEEAAVSTGMLNHYFANREDLLTQALVFVSVNAQGRMREAIAGMPAGIERLKALLDAALVGEEAAETWRVWITTYGEAVRLPSLRHTIEDRLHSWYELIDYALEGVAPEPHGSIPWSWRLDAVLNGLSIQALTSEAALDSVQIRDEVLRTLFGEEPDRRSRGRAGAPGNGPAPKRSSRSAAALPSGSTMGRRSVAREGAVGKSPAGGQPATSKRQASSRSTASKPAAKR